MVVCAQFEGVKARSKDVEWRLSRGSFSFNVSLGFQRPLFREIVPIRANAVRGHSSGDDHRPFSNEDCMCFYVEDVTAVILLGGSEVVLCCASEDA